MKLTGADIVMECMLEQGVDTIFGYPGGTILNIYDAVYKYSDKINHVLTAHEQGASHAADGYARSTGKPGVVFATSGPGATNLVTGIATAYMDSVPLVAITCNVATNWLGRDTFQEIDIVGVTMPITKHNFLVKDVNDLADTIRKAFRIAQTGRPGPVLVDITKDATAEMTEYERVIPAKIDNNIMEATASEIQAACQMIAEAKRPLIYAGGGIIASGASAELIKFRELTDAPITLSLMGKGAYPEHDSAYTGMIGMHGTKTTSLAVRDCDLLIAIGARFSDRVICNPASFARNAKVLHIDIDRAEIDKNITTALSLSGDAKAVLSELNKALTPQTHTEWMAQIAAWKKEFTQNHPEAILSPQYIIETLQELTNSDAIITTDVGQHQMWTSQFYQADKPRHFITSGGLGTMGFGLGAAIGAQMGNPDKKVINIAGDGCFHMNMNELSTAAKQELPIIEIIMNNNVLGMVRQWQRLFYGKRFSTTTLDKKTNYDMVAEGLGAKAYTVTSKEEYRAALESALKETNVPSVINCVIDKDMNVLPMVPGGQSIEEPILDIVIDD
uniref:Acetolactate synthase n=1 Tax=uncultured Bacillota bacterium TaxID=344338 RepID=A0A650EMQ1_9FIRM|nr:acetolactate synthase [uncultured Firmicutes bacterium]